MKITVEVENIDYGALVERFLPVVADKLSEKDGAGAAILAKCAKIPPSIAAKMIDVLPQETKDDIASTLIEKNKDQLISMITDYSDKNGVVFEIKSLHVDA